MPSVDMTVYLGGSLRKSGARLLACQHLHENHAQAEDVTWQAVLLRKQHLGRHELRRPRAKVLHRVACPARPAMSYTRARTAPV